MEPVKNSNKGLKIAVLVILSLLFDGIVLLAFFSVLRLLLRPMLFPWALFFTGLSLFIFNTIIITKPIFSEKLDIRVQVPMIVWTGIFFIGQNLFTFSLYYFVTIKMYILISLILFLFYIGPISAFLFLNDRAKGWGRS